MQAPHGQPSPLPLLNNVGREGLVFTLGLLEWNTDPWKELENFLLTVLLTTKNPVMLQLCNKLLLAKGTKTVCHVERTKKNCLA